MTPGYLYNFIQGANMQDATMPSCDTAIQVHFLHDLYLIPYHKLSHFLRISVEHDSVADP